MKKKKILFVAMQQSIHTARWINQISREDYEIHVFPINSGALHPDLMGTVIVHQPFYNLGKKQYIKSFFKKNENEKPIYNFPLPRIFKRFFGALTHHYGDSGSSISFLYGPFFLKKLIKKLKPDLIHSLEFQHCSYNVLETKRTFNPLRFPKWLATNWGSDIYLFQHDKNHAFLIKELLQKIDYYSCECKRDVDLALSLGCTAKIQPVMPNTGGFDISQADFSRHLKKTSERKTILIKGYQHFAGRALLALDAVEACANLLEGYRVLVYSATADVKERIKYLKDCRILDIEYLKDTNHGALLRYFSQSRIYIGVSISDAISTSLLESMAMGAFPIQTNTSCCDEWIKSGETGYSIDCDKNSIITALKYALADDKLVDSAAEKNWEIVKKRLDADKLRVQVSDFYTKIFEEK